MGLDGNLGVDLDSGNVEVRLDPSLEHFAGCAANDECEEMGYAIGNPDSWYSMILENRGTFSASDEFVCNATIDCGSFPDCMIDQAFCQRGPEDYDSPELPEEKRGELRVCVGCLE